MNIGGKFGKSGGWVRILVGDTDVKRWRKNDIPPVCNVSHENKRQTNETSIAIGHHRFFSLSPRFASFSSLGHRD